nr:Os03g0158800 [Ipomoea trifida]
MSNNLVAPVGDWRTIIDNRYPSLGAMAMVSNREYDLRILATFPSYMYYFDSIGPTFVTVLVRVMGRFKSGMVIEGKFTSKMEKPSWQDMSNASANLLIVSPSLNIGSPEDRTCSKPVVTIADFIAVGDQSGWAALSSATIPATCGVAIDVPLRKLYVLIRTAGSLGTYAANIFVPGAAISGYKLLQYQKVMAMLSLGNLNFLEGAK